LHSEELPSPDGIDVASKVSQEGFLAELNETVVGEQSIARWRTWESRRQCGIVFTCVGRPRGNIDQRCDVRMETRFADDHSGEGVPYENRGPVLTR
jgi:hypothetical protein